MLYNPPTGSTDPNAPFLGKNPASGQIGSKVPPPAIEHPQREIVAAIVAAGLTPTSSDLTQLAQAIKVLAAGFLHIGNDVSGNPAQVVVDVAPSITAYVANHEYLTSAANVCPGGAVKANFDGVGLRPIVRSDNSPLVAGDWTTGDRLLFGDDGTSLRLIGLTKKQVQELAGSSTTISNAIYNLSPGGLTTITASAGLQQQTDLAPVPSYTTIFGTPSFNGATFVTCQGACALRVETGSGGSGTVRFGLFDEAQGALVATSPYVGGSFPTQGNQSPYTVPGYVFKGLDKSKKYHVVILGQKGVNGPQMSTWDPSITIQTDGSPA